MFEKLLEKEKKESCEQGRSAEELKIYNTIEIGVIKRSNLEPSEWTEHYAKGYEDFFNSNKELVMRLYNEDKEELFALTKAALEIEDGD